MYPFWPLTSNTAAPIPNCGADNAGLLPLLDRAAATLGEPLAALADAGYPGEATFQTLEARGITAYISLGHETRPGKPPNPAHRATQRMADRLKSEGGRARYRRRKAIVEPVIGWIKEVLGFRRFSVRDVDGGDRAPSHRLVSPFLPRRLLDDEFS